ncbi:Cell surface superoxide dismutase [Cu-Zn] 4 [Smittium culicis]|uniref:Cell surface superoxide dismutase [Cu-Zn] 4 n=1 Tax=Smittium culicis TaxID=133412 RepID=A0A1R1Y1H0_9FUNG|nr:Cell surface superoxide dismutase [Cu-Zn] 4 [Smittium culicis]
MFKLVSLLSLALFASNASSEKLSRVIARPVGEVSGSFIFHEKQVLASGSSSDYEKKLFLDVKIKDLTPNSIYNYHVHVLPVPTNGSCAATLLHFDPTGKNKLDGTYKCNPADIKGTCEYGDLSGYFGPAFVNSTGEVYEKTFQIDYLSLDPTSDVSILGRSVVIHNSTGGRIACGNLVKVSKC